VLRILAAPKLSLIDQVGSRKECIAQGRSARSSGIAHLLIGLPIIVEQPIIEELSKAWGFAVAPGVVSSCRVMFVRLHPPASREAIIRYNRKPKTRSP
jgi:hypothetical protein